MFVLACLFTFANVKYACLQRAHSLQQCTEWAVGGFVLSLCQSPQQGHFNEKIILHFGFASSKIHYKHRLTEALFTLKLIPLHLNIDAPAKWKKKKVVGMCFTFSLIGFILFN